MHHHYWITFPLTLALFLGADYGWNRLIMGRFYSKPLGPILLELYSPYSIGAFLLLYVAAMMYFVVPEYPDETTWLATAKYGVIYATVIYGTMDLISYVYLHSAILVLTLVDFLWGVALTVLAPCLAVSVAQMVLG